MDDVGELTVPLQDGSERSIQPQDVLELMNMPLKQAQARAEELYGPFASHVMGHRTELKRIHQEMTEALDNARKNGAERERATNEARSAQTAQTDKFIADTFKEVYDASLADPQNGRFFKQVEGDKEWNASLQRGRELSSVFLKRPDEHGLSTEQRRERVEQLAALFNRSSAYGPMKLLVGRLEKELATVKKELAGYKDSKPDLTGGQRPLNGQPATYAREIDKMRAELRKLGR
jgi:hypothetical protein